MTTLTVSVKWNRELYKDVDCDTSESPDVFKAQLFALTGVLPERQKVMVKGKTLGASWDGFPITNKATILMMGSKEESIPTGPAEQTKFVEDMNEAELATAMDLPLGLQNLGNTCYMNATIQCLKTVPNLREALKKFSGRVVDPDEHTSVTAALRDVYLTMDQGMAIPPFILLQALHKAFPRFTERDNQGHLSQQDANECWTELLRTLQQKLPADETSKQPSAIDQYMGGRFSVEMKCDEAESEPVSTSTESFLQLSCFIETETRYMHSGLIGKLTEKITKNSPTLERDAVYTKTSKIDRLPAYLTVQMVRFFYKEKQGGGGGVNAKILKDVKFPMTLDVYDLCSKRLQEKLLPMREKFKEWEDEEAQRKLDKANKAVTSRLKEEEAKSKNYAPYHFEDDLGSNNSGFYELQAVLTHKGRSSSSGHYVAWVKHNADVWLMCDDDKVQTVTSEDVLKLSGGGDWHIAYVLLYGPRLLELGEGKTIEPVRCEVAEPESMSTE